MKQRSGKLWKKCKQIAAYVMMFAMMASLMPATVVKADEPESEAKVQNPGTGLHFANWQEEPGEDDESQVNILDGLSELCNMDLPYSFSTSLIFTKQKGEGVAVTTEYTSVKSDDITITYCKEVLEDDELIQEMYDKASFGALEEGQMEIETSSETLTYDSTQYNFPEGTKLSLTDYQFNKSGTYKFTYKDGEKEYSCYLQLTHRAWDFYETDAITDNPLRDYYYQDISQNPTFYLKRDDDSFQLGKLTYDENDDVIVDQEGKPVLDKKGAFTAGVLEWNDDGEEEWKADCSDCIAYEIIDADTVKITLTKDPSEVAGSDIEDYMIRVYFYTKNISTDIDGNPVTDESGKESYDYWHDTTDIWIHNGEDMSNSVWVGYDDNNGKVEWKPQDSADAERQVLQPWCEVKGDKDGTYDMYLTEKPDYPDDFDWNGATEEECNKYGWRAGAEPVVRINHHNGTTDLYKVGDTEFPIDDCHDTAPTTWHFTYKYEPLDGVDIFWSDYDAFGYNETEQFQIEMNSDDSQGSITITPEPDQDNSFIHESYGKKYNYSVDQIGQVSVTFTPDEGCEIYSIQIGNIWYVNETCKEEADKRPTFSAEEDGSYTHTFTKEELMQYDFEGQPVIDNNGKQTYDRIYVDAAFIGNPFDNGFNWNVNTESKKLANDGIKSVSYKVGDADWTTLSEKQLKNLYFVKPLENKEQITVKVEMNEGYALDPSHSWAGYYADDQAVDYKIDGSEDVMQDIVTGLMSEAGYTFTFDPVEHSKDTDGNPTITGDAILALQTGVIKTYEKSCTIHMFVQSEAGRDEDGSIIYAEGNTEDGYIEDTQGNPDLEFTFNDNYYGGQSVETQTNNGSNPIKVQWISTIPGKNKGNPVDVTPSSYLEFLAGGYTNGDTPNVIRISDRLIDKVYIDTNMDGTFAADELVKPNENNVYEISLGAAEKYNILIRKHASDDATLSWTYIKDENDLEQDNLVEHGRVYVKEIKRDGKKLLGDMHLDENGKVVLDKNGRPQYDTWTEDIRGDFTKSRGDITARNGDEVTLLLIPTYGYQLKSTSINGQEVAPQEEMSTFKVTLNGNLHFSSIFEKADNVTAVKAKEVSAATIADGENAADSGNLSLTVKNNTKYDTDVTSAVKLGADETIQKIASLDMTLDNIVSKGSENEYWTKNISSFKDAITVGLTLKDVTLAQGESLAVIRDHEGKLTSLDAKYDAAGKTLTFPTNQFSTYTIVKIVKKEKEPEPTPTPTPTPEHKHNLVKTEEKAATATTAGNKAYWTCSDCGKVYSDAEGTTETTVAAMTIAATGVPEKGTRLQDAKTGVSYVVTSKDGKNPTVTYSGNKNNKAKTITVPSTVTVDGVTYKVTAIADNAFKNNKKVTKVVIPSNIITIGKNAFNGCSKLKTIQIKSTKLTSKSISKNAFKGISKKVTIKVPKKKLKAYKKLFRKKGLSKKVKMKS